MQTIKSKNKKLQLPNQVVAVQKFRKLIGAYFEMNSLPEVNRILTEMLSAATGPDPRSGKHSPIAISNTLYDVNQIIKLLTQTKPLANEKSFYYSTKKLAYQIQAVSYFDVPQLAELLYYGLNAYIFQDEDFEGVSLNFANEITHAYKLLYDWFADCDAWYKHAKQNEGRSLASEIN